LQHKVVVGNTSKTTDPRKRLTRLVKSSTGREVWEDNC